ncbi:undecaprenyl-diphosphate phosphatase [Candidatus Venteria ishoeyi]|uniref:Undecaprenyl-diphosphatase n=1 Tax=Candidatus Venteria ishoeyi TaxID=1899563 RepID=A0A1H6FEH4_9GAMM|nr:undecaprenyl-diphosphate phosphatase [Candidatus Venteria ishoeyi]MDM8546259.1 undecaprenyl-diphosphate phosphatase [Candidatus Venteria ishoeyi]SEH07424.1 Undecaprenyl-diphosphatase [Candidatus Venteria ishoeyi]
MELTQIIFLAILQGLTEFLPISSSAHLILLPYLLNWPDQGLAFDVAVHLGSLGAVLWYFRRDLHLLLGNWFNSLRGRAQTPESRLVWGVALGTIPVALSGLLFADAIETHLRNIPVIALATIGFGVLLGYADWTGKRQRSEYQLNWKDILIIGLAQALALIPGTSRSGITITAALLLGLNRTAAARFSFLLSIPVILLAGGYDILKLLLQEASVDWFALLLAAVISGLMAYACIYTFIKLLDKIGMQPFVIYRLLLGFGLLLFWIY